MSKKVRKVRYYLDDKEIKNLPHDEIAAILRGADSLIMSGGRTLLSKVLKGSQDKKVLQLDLDKNPFYGYYKQLSISDILARIDWVIINGYLSIEYDYRLPLLVYTAKGWGIEKETYANELLQGFDEMLAGGAHFFNMSYLKDRNRELILLLLEKVEKTGDKKYIPILEAWEQIDYKKVRDRIHQVIKHLERGVT